LNACLADDQITGQKEAQVSHIPRGSVEYAQFKAIFKQATRVSSVWTEISARWAKSTIASKLLVFEQLLYLQKASNEGILAFFTRCTNLYCDLGAVGCLNEGMFAYKGT
jgi:hypothetical protein